MNIRKGDRMEYEEVARILSLDIDVEFYLVKGIIGLCARFVTGCKEFAITDDTSVESTKEDDEKIIKSATKYLKNFIRETVNNKTNVKIGQAYRTIFKEARDEIYNQIYNKYGYTVVDIIDGLILDYTYFNKQHDNTPYGYAQSPCQNIYIRISEYTQKYIDGDMERIKITTENIKKLGIPNDQLYDKLVSNYIVNSKDMCREHIGRLYKHMQPLAIRYETYITNLVYVKRYQQNQMSSTGKTNYEKLGMGLANPDIEIEFSDDEIKIIKEFRSYVYMLLSTELIIGKYAAIIRSITQ
jgi:hypothetical protein